MSNPIDCVWDYHLCSSLHYDEAFGYLAPAIVEHGYLAWFRKHVAQRVDQGVRRFFLWCPHGWYSTEGVLPMDPRTHLAHNPWFHGQMKELDESLSWAEEKWPDVRFVIYLGSHRCVSARAAYDKLTLDEWLSQYAMPQVLPYTHRRNVDIGFDQGSYMRANSARRDLDDYGDRYASMTRLLRSMHGCGVWYESVYDLDASETHLARPVCACIVWWLRSRPERHLDSAWAAPTHRYTGPLMLLEDARANNEGEEGRLSWVREAWRHIAPAHRKPGYRHVAITLGQLLREGHRIEDIAERYLELPA